ncbi:M28 family peptidase [Roseivirga echinicomitans]|uniref:Peptidase M28 n=1 Tax=Roseivirga echinicomitans TaxID=296218 RepID=A0A150XK79_9BACT|nr:M28 family peptidase [Roseivirga echinicomitans]KYG79147.1 peptidase M28 [Roseivirga echinicomitans]
MKRTLILFLGITLSVFQANAQQLDSFIEDYYTMADAEFNQESAFETVDYVQQYWRLAGNEGFNNSIYHVVEKLKNAGYVLEENAKATDRLTYRIEKRPMSRPTWEPVSGSLKIGNKELLNLKTNFNMIASYSYSTGGEKEYEVVYVEKVSAESLDGMDLKGKVVMTEGSPGRTFNEAVKKHGAAGVITYGLPAYNQPEKHQNSISFTGISNDEEAKAFGVLLSYKAHEILKKTVLAGQTKVKINLETKIYESEELTLVAEVKGSALPNERFVFSAHVQEPGANDNATGVGALGEVASSTARLLKAGKVNPARTITYLFGDEIVSTRRYVQEDAERAKGIKWGMSLDMVGENTAITGGSFLIEKMPDPGAIWTRGKEKHSEWGGRPLKKEQLKPHYFNDLTIGVFDMIGERKNWEVNYNPFEGGSDHTPFLQANIPGLLLWHFTDQFYHTDQDRIDKVSPVTLKNVGIGAMIISFALTENNDRLAHVMLSEASMAATMRLQAELKLSQEALANGGDLAEQKDIINTWADYYRDVFNATLDIEPKGMAAFKENLQATQDALMGYRNMIMGQLK